MNKRKRKKLAKKFWDNYCIRKMYKGIDVHGMVYESTFMQIMEGLQETLGSIIIVNEKED